MIPKIMNFEIRTLYLYRIIDMHSKYDNMRKNEIFYALICINNDIITCLNWTLSTLNSIVACHKAQLVARNFVMALIMQKPYLQLSA